MVFAGRLLVLPLSPRFHTQSSRTRRSVQVCLARHLPRYLLSPPVRGCLTSRAVPLLYLLTYLLTYRTQAATEIYTRSRTIQPPDQNSETHVRAKLSLVHYSTMTDQRETKGSQPRGCGQRHGVRRADSWVGMWYVVPKRPMENRDRVAMSVSVLKWSMSLLYHMTILYFLIVFFSSYNTYVYPAPELRICIRCGLKLYDVS
ncbi:hypothetical protein F5Y00DRAFT_237889 [Daldinia vernicosa]|uniref:uncharacterized protein n=1 Tax=Daldinia vernicosa TaxID=114800 RepID=UPI0020077A08|nr:uncharacterized protein F5Y00DRAFT_237889 [Daldinia vernicosa]KAI0848615.1 hypothetical protein F5Y00DRAFT_237889 [Daldinia vernicosa]